MKITAIHSFMRKGSTYHLAQEVINRVCPTGSAEKKEFFLPRDMPHACLGCFTCISKEGAACPHANEMQPILQALDEADVIVLSSATYVYDVTGQMKAFLDHCAYRWMVHRPAPAMFHKTGLVVSTSAGAGHKRACKTMALSLEYWGVAKIHSFGEAVQAASWDGIAKKKKAALLKKAARFAGSIQADVAKGERLTPGWKVRGLFFVMGRMIKALASKTGGHDAEYWTKMGWYDGKRPW